MRIHMSNVCTTRGLILPIPLRWYILSLHAVNNYLQQEALTFASVMKKYRAAICAVPVPSADKRKATKSNLNRDLRVGTLGGPSENHKTSIALSIVSI